MSQKKDPKEEIMEATYKALCKHGYSGLSIQRIADESEKGKSLIYYHFDDKQDLMNTFLENMIETLEEDVLELEELDPEQKLDRLLEVALAINDEEMWEFRKALMEIEAHTPHNEELAERFRKIDRFICGKFEEAFKELDVEKPEMKAELTVSMINGLMNRKIGHGSREGIEEMKEELKNIVTN